MSKIQKIYVIYDNIKIKNHDMGGGGWGCVAAFLGLSD